ncbi:IucA/IucC family protein [Streptomyces sp. NPDC040750]|uniref:IucA/IucC family protein n=1 Tax=Streptomyces sp. NPDC040750 TaxID=3154491 RepID=UPI0033C2257A
MNDTPTPDGRSGAPDEQGDSGASNSPVPLADSVPQQKRRSVSVTRPAEPGADALDDPDPGTAAQAAAVENLLRCWVRETDLAAPATGTLHIPLPASGASLTVPVRYWSPTGWHRFGTPRLTSTPMDAPPVDAVTLAALLTRETAPRDSGPHDAFTAQAPPTEENAFAADGTPHTPDDTPRIQDGTPRPHGTTPLHPDSTSRTSPRTITLPTPGTTGATGDGGDLVARVADSVRHTATFIQDRRAHPADTPDLFLGAEQALLLGHPLHPTPKGREGLTDAEARLYSPELRGSFPLHWMAVAPLLLATDSAWTERGRTVPADHLTRRLAGAALPLPDGYTALPLHPWQARDVRHREPVAALLDSGLLRDLGPAGAPWHPTSSVRTVHRSGAPAMLKLSLGLRITNSRRENLRKELHRGVEMHRLLRTGLFKEWQAVHPGFDIVRDPAWLAVDGPDGVPVPGLDVMIRHNPFAPADDVGCVAGLVSPRPLPDEHPDATHPQAARPAAATAPTGLARPMRSRLDQLVARLAARTGRPVGAVAAEWFLRYLEQVVRPVLWLDSEAGVALEAHQQNTLVLLDDHGWPVGGRYRDNQGYYFRESRRADLSARLPGIGERSDTFVSDEVTDERFAYYLAVNNVFGLIGALGSQGLADERLLLAAFRRFLTGLASGPGALRTPLPDRLLDSPVLRCKANLLTRLRGLDELVGPVDTQSVYVTIANPLHS